MKNLAQLRLSPSMVTAFVALLVDLGGSDGGQQFVLR